MDRTGVSLVQLEIKGQVLSKSPHAFFALNTDQLTNIINIIIE